MPGGSPTGLKKNPGGEELYDSGWHMVGDPGEPAFENSWTNYGSPFTEAGFRRIGNVVYLQGLIKSGSAAADAFQLPLGYRPSFGGTGTTGIYTGLESGNTAARIDILEDGGVYMSVASATWTSLENIRFITDEPEP